MADSAVDPAAGKEVSSGLRVERVIRKGPGRDGSVRAQDTLLHQLGEAFGVRPVGKKSNLLVRPGLGGKGGKKIPKKAKKTLLYAVQGLLYRGQ